MKKLSEIGAGPFAPEHLNGTEGDPIANIKGLCRLQGIDFDSGHFFILARDQRRELVREAINKWDEWADYGMRTIEDFLDEQGL